MRAGFPCENAVYYHQFLKFLKYGDVIYACPLSQAPHIWDKWLNVHFLGKNSCYKAKNSRMFLYYIDR